MHFQWADRQLRLAVPVVTIWGQVGCQVEMRSHMVYSPATGPWPYLMTQWDPHTHTHTYLQELAAYRSALIQQRGGGSLSE